jgi:hypothetical protein
MVFTLATTAADHSVWWWILGIVAVIGMIWWWSAASGARMEVGTPSAEPRPPESDKQDAKSGSDQPKGKG